ncbi:conserved hypothetical protein [sediment metagenome]|uniref:Type II toxin-antitoxin system HigB family toxin n=1 Tax=sediment metagenome TaxID=749907 RepID=D9PKE7_9ZZZZ
MNVVSQTRLRLFWTTHPTAKGSLANWYRTVSHARWTCFADVRKTYNSADLVGNFVVFNIGDYFRVVVDIAYATRHVYIKHVFTHPEYERWNP